MNVNNDCFSSLPNELKNEVFKHLEFPVAMQARLISRVFDEFICANLPTGFEIDKSKINDKKVSFLTITNASTYWIEPFFCEPNNFSLIEVIYYFQMFNFRLNATPKFIEHSIKADVKKKIDERFHSYIARMVRKTESIMQINV